MQGQNAAKYVQLANTTFSWNNTNFLYTNYFNTATKEKLREWTKKIN